MGSSLTLGEFQINFISDGTFRLDGGAMFGIVPKVLWSRQSTGDERNRILLSCNCPLIRIGRETILIDCGLGRKWTPKQREIYAIDERPRLIEELAALGVKPADITTIIHTHLHLDHAGWNTQLDAEGKLVPVFTRARHVLERRELAIAHEPNELQQGTYLSENIRPIDETGGWDVFDDSKEIVPGLTVFRTGGHTNGHCVVRLESRGQKALFASELVPTTAHLQLSWLMAYDSFPLEALEAKRRVVAECLAEQTLVMLNHDPHAFAIRLQPGDSKRPGFMKIC